MAEGIVYFGTHDYNLYVLRATAGRLIWSYSTRSLVPSSAAVVDGVVYVESWDSVVCALDTKAGKPVWGCHTDDSVFSSPAVVDGVVYIGSDDGSIYALEADSGNLVWHYRQCGQDRIDSPSNDSRFCIVGRLLLSRNNQI